MMAKNAQINNQSHVLDLGCGNGAVAAWLCREFGCRVTGIDLSNVRIVNANKLRQTQPAAIKQKLKFSKSSATNLGYLDDSFTHVWSQAVIYHVHDKKKVIEEVHRVLVPGGRFVFDDLIKPQPEICEDTQTFVYDRLKYDTDFDFESYQNALSDTGFNIIKAQDISAHLKTSYELLAEIAEKRAEDEAEKYQKVVVAYRKMTEAIDRQELGWALYVCNKDSPLRDDGETHNRVQWVYASRTCAELTERYDEWSLDYDTDLAEKFGWVGPQRAADVFSRYVARDGKVLDAGAGTGIVGQCLAKLGYSNLTGIDLSQGMLQQAEKKGVYRELRKMALGEPLDFPTDAFDGIISVGVFTLGHAPAHSLRELVRIVKPGGHIVFAIRPDVYETAGFREMQAELETKGQWVLVEVSEAFQTLPKGEPDVYHQVWVFQITKPQVQRHGA